MLRVLLERRELWVEKEDFENLFWRAAGYGDVDIIRVFWNAAVELDENTEHTQSLRNEVSSINPPTFLSKTTT
jgi:hypothetical protein